MERGTMNNADSKSNDETLAKKLYLDHRGNGFFMERAGVYETYRQFRIEREREVEWAKEEIERLLDEFAENGPRSDCVYRYLIDFIRVADDLEGLQTLLHLARREMANLDTMTLVLIAEATLQLMKKSGRAEVFNRRELLEEEFVLIKDLLKRASTMEFRVAPKFFKVGLMKDLLSEEQVRDRIRRDIRELESYSFPWDYKGRIVNWLRRSIGRSSE